MEGCRSFLGSSGRYRYYPRLFVGGGTRVDGALRYLPKRHGLGFVGMELGLYSQPFGGRSHCGPVRTLDGFERQLRIVGSGNPRFTDCRHCNFPFCDPISLWGRPQCALSIPVIGHCPLLRTQSTGYRGGALFFRRPDGSGHRGSADGVASGPIWLARGLLLDWWRKSPLHPGLDRSLPRQKGGRQTAIKRGETETAVVKIPWLLLLRHRSVWGMVFGQMGYLYCYFFFVTWLPSYLIMERGMTILETGIVASLPFWMGMVATVTGGAVGDALIRRGFSRTASRKTHDRHGTDASHDPHDQCGLCPQTWLAVTLLVCVWGASG